MSDKLDARLNAFAASLPSPEVQAIMTRVRESYQALAGLLDGAIPASRETSLALTDAGGVVDSQAEAVPLIDPRT